MPMSSPQITRMFGLPSGIAPPCPPARLAHSPRWVYRVHRLQSPSTVPSIRGPQPGCKNCILPGWLRRSPQYRSVVSVMRGPLRSLPLADRAVFVVVGALVVLASLASRPEGSGTGRSMDVSAVALLAAGLGFAALATRAAATGALGTLVVIMVWYGLGYRSGLINLPFLIAFYLLGATGDRVRQLAVGSLAVVLSLIGMLAAGNESASSAAAAIGWIFVAML